MKSNKLLKYFLIFFIVSLILFNWNRFGLIFNYRVISNYFTNYFEKVFSKNKIMEKELEDNGFSLEEEVIKEGTISIPSINITAPIVFFDESQEEDLLHQALDRGVVHFPESALPGKIGQTIILGHSAPLGWPRINYDWIFSEIGNLEEGEEIIINFNNKEYFYEVKDKVILEKGEEIPLKYYSNSKNILILLSCWPPGQDYKRIVVMSEIKQLLDK